MRTRRSVLWGLPVLVVMVLALFGVSQGLTTSGVAGSVRSVAASAADQAVALSATAPADVEPELSTAPSRSAESVADRSLPLFDQIAAAVRGSRAPPAVVA
jgi:hypothetical protein